jgi:hypothetical protein
MLAALVSFSLVWGWNGRRLVSFKSEPEVKVWSGSSPSFQTCAAARAAGYSSMRRGQPGYSSHLDADGDGIACEPWLRW